MDRVEEEVNMGILNLHERMEHVESRIREACKKTGRLRDDIQVIAVTKYVDVAATEQVLKEGFLHIGENRWQVAQDKWKACGHLGTWHFIGHLQTNKVKDIVGKFQYVHSLDRLSLARELDKKAGAIGATVNCFIQVNVSGEESKYGLPPDQLFSFALELVQLSHIRIVGLMTMAPLESEPEATRPVFAGLRQLRDALNEQSIFPYAIPHLSMGMSNDFDVAIEEGATWVRLGSILVGNK